MSPYPWQKKAWLELNSSTSKLHHAYLLIGPLGAVKKLGMIAIDRSQGIQSLRYVNEQTAEYVEYRPVIIFPEGTRTTYGEEPDLKPGIFSMYKSLNKPVVPIALNTGLYWPKNNKIKSGEILIEFKDPIQPGLSKQEFLDQLKKAINSLNH